MRVERLVLIIFVRVAAIKYQMSCNVPAVMLSDPGAVFFFKPVIILLCFTSVIVIGIKNIEF